MLMAEAQSCGTPVIAFAKGGATEIVCDVSTNQATGVLYASQTPEAIQRAVERFEEASDRITSENCRSNAVRFDRALFLKRMDRVIEVAWNQWATSKTAPNEDGLQQELDSL